MHPTGVNFCVIKMVDEKPYILLQQRDEKSPTNKLKWCIPGGGKDQFDEPFIETAVRELKEEYAIEVSLENMHKVCEKQPNTDGEAHGEVFATFVDEDVEIVMGEGKSYGWYAVDELSDLDLGFGHGELIPKLQEFLEIYFKNKEPNSEIKPFKIS